MHGGVNSNEKFQLNTSSLGSVILYTLPIVGILGFIISLALGMYNYSLLCTYLVIPMVFAPLIYLAYSKKSLDNESRENNVFKWLILLYVIAFTLTIVTLATFQVRPFIYYVLIGICGTCILLEILLFEISKPKELIILAQTILFFLNLVWGVNLKYFQFIGRTDNIGHAWYVTNLLATGHVTDIFFDYQNFALWHILNDTLFLLTGMTIPAYKMMFIACGLVFSILIVFAYLLTIKVTDGRRFALLTSLKIGRAHV